MKKVIRDMSALHHTRRVYPDGTFVDNVVAEIDIDRHIEFNMVTRPECAFFVDGRCRTYGYIPKERCISIEKELEQNPIPLDKATKPYK